MKNKSIGYAILLILFILFNTIVFVLPIEKNNNFWITYAFTFLAFVMQIVIWHIGFNKNKDISDIFYGLPIIHISILYLIVQIIAFCVLMQMLNYGYRVHVIVNVSILCVVLVLVLIAMFGGNEIKKSDYKEIKYYETN